MTSCYVYATTTLLAIDTRASDFMQIYKNGGGLRHIAHLRHGRAPQPQGERVTRVELYPQPLKRSSKVTAHTMGTVEKNCGTYSIRSAGTTDFVAYIVVVLTVGGVAQINHLLWMRVKSMPIF